MGMIHERIIAIMAESEAIAKAQKNLQQGFMFRGIDDVYNSIHPLFAKHGVFSTTEILSEKSEERQTKTGATLIYRILTIRFTFFAADGSSVSSVIIGEGMDSGDKASNKAMAIAHKYAIVQLLVIPTADQKDPDAESFEVAPKETAHKEVQPKTDKEVALTKLGKFSPEEREEYYKKHGGLILGVSPDGKKQWSNIDWASLNKDLGND